MLQNVYGNPVLLFYYSRHNQLCSNITAQSIPSMELAAGSLFKTTTGGCALLGALFSQNVGAELPPAHASQMTTWTLCARHGNL